MKGKHVLITGATNGIGEATAMAVASQGATLTLLCRNRAKGQAVVAKIAAQTGNKEVSLLIADLNDIASVNRAADEFIARDTPLHVLINNAGVVNLHREILGASERMNGGKGVEAMFYTNHLAHFVLTLRLVPELVKSAPARIVIVASDAHTFIKDLSWSDLAAEQKFSIMPRYGESKLANIWFMRELSRRLAGSGISVNAVHPGAVGTGLGAQNGWLGKIVTRMIRPFMKTPENGARTSIHLATTDAGSKNSGLYFVDCKPSSPKPWALDDNRALRLWELSETLTGTEWSLP